LKDVAVDQRVVHSVDAEFDEHVGVGARPQVSESPAGNRPYSWMSDYLPRLDGKVARQEYYARLKQSSRHPLDGPAAF
jgi:hypothetical protein